MTGHLQRRRGAGLSCWFSLHRPWLSKIRTGHWSYAPSVVVDELIYAFEELEDWWANNRASTHIPELPYLTPAVQTDLIGINEALTTYRYLSRDNLRK